MVDRMNEAGFSEGKPVIIKTQDSEYGVAAEYECIEARFGERDEAWRFVMQKLMRGTAGQWLDILEIKLADGSSMQLFFDISSFFGAFNGLDSINDDEGGTTLGESRRQAKRDAPGSGNSH